LADKAGGGYFYERRILISLKRDILLRGRPLLLIVDIFFAIALTRGAGFIEADFRAEFYRYLHVYGLHYRKLKGIVIASTFFVTACDVGFTRTLYQRFPRIGERRYRNRHRNTELPVDGFFAGLKVIACFFIVTI
jgi:hypothetical protein